MYPVLFQIGPVVVYSYGFFLALAYLAATFVFWREGKKRGFKGERLIDFSVASLIAAIVGGRVFYSLINLHLFSEDPLQVLAVWQGGFSYYGSFILVFLVGSFLVRKWRWDFFQVADFASLAVLVAIFFGKIGTFLSGSDYGTLTSLPWGVTTAFLEGTRHPVQLYEAFYSLILFVLLYRLYQKNLSRIGDFRSGSVFLYFVFFHSVGRIIFEQFRGDSTYFGFFPLASLIAFILAAISLLALYYYQFRNLLADLRAISKRVFGMKEIRFRSPFKKIN